MINRELEKKLLNEEDEFYGRKRDLTAEFNEYMKGLLQKLRANGYEVDDDITEVTIPEGVTEIEDMAFYGCISLKSINIPDSVTKIGEDAFSDCRSLKSINIPDGVTKIGENAFGGCQSLTSIHIPEGVTEIGANAFNGCQSLTSIYIPDSVNRKIGEWAFANCNSLKTINISAGLDISEAKIPKTCKIIRRKSSDSLTESKKNIFKEDDKSYKEDPKLNIEDDDKKSTSNTNEYEYDPYEGFEEKEYYYDFLDKDFLESKSRMFNNVYRRYN